MCIRDRLRNCVLRLGAMSAAHGLMSRAAQLWRPVSLTSVFEQWKMLLYAHEQRTHRGVLDGAVDRSAHAAVRLKLKQLRGAALTATRTVARQRSRPCDPDDEDGQALLAQVEGEAQEVHQALQKTRWRAGVLMVQSTARARSDSQLWSIVQFWVRAMRVAVVAAQAEVEIEELQLRRQHGASYSAESTIEIALVGCKNCFDQQRFVDTLAVRLGVHSQQIAVHCVLAGSVVVQLKIVDVVDGNNGGRSAAQAIDQLLRLRHNQLPGYKVTSISVVPPAHLEATSRLVEFAQRHTARAHAWGVLCMWHCTASARRRERELLKDHEQRASSAQSTMDTLVQHIEVLESSKPQPGLAFSQLQQSREPAAAVFDHSAVLFEEKAEQIGACEDGFLSFLVPDTPERYRQSTPRAAKKREHTKLWLLGRAFLTQARKQLLCVRAVCAWRLKLKKVEVRSVLNKPSVPRVKKSVEGLEEALRDIRGDYLGQLRRRGGESNDQHTCRVLGLWRKGERLWVFVQLKEAGGGAQLLYCTGTAELFAAESSRNSWHWVALQNVRRLVVVTARLCRGTYFEHWRNLVQLGKVRSQLRRVEVECSYGEGQMESHMEECTAQIERYTQQEQQAQWGAAFHTMRSCIRVQQLHGLMDGFWGWKFVVSSKVLSMASEASDLAEADLAKFQHKYEALLNTLASKQNASTQRWRQTVLLLQATSTWSGVASNTRAARVCGHAVMQRAQLLTALAQLCTQGHFKHAWYVWVARVARAVAFRSRRDSIQLVHDGARWSTDAAHSAQLRTLEHSSRMELLQSKMVPILETLSLIHI
eukprot:TRINITY_DN49935_c0_g1_i2.p1 TRINITY_DN49935_c0_g1~~TRINITY_DN49935_c0_g1_i2.p1  ORF type:complete len:816 (-),score=203.87 TRINITY_DN49935_c0_g1_i2:33-2480(-)